MLGKPVVKPWFTRYASFKLRPQIKLFAFHLQTDVDSDHDSMFESAPGFGYHGISKYPVSGKLEPK